MLRFLGSEREIAMFEQHRTIGPIVKVVPMASGEGAVLAVINDPNYQEVTSHLSHTVVVIC
jgi:hypothetical protein